MKDAGPAFGPAPRSSGLGLRFAGRPMTIAAMRIAVDAGGLEVPGTMVVPDGARGTVVFAHGSGSSHRSPRNARVAERLHREGFATLRFDLLTPDEARDRSRVFDVALLATRLRAAAGWMRGRPETASTRLAFFGASTGAAAALVAAAEMRGEVAAVVSRGGRPDLAGPALERVTAPTLLIVGGRDPDVLELNRRARSRLAGESRVDVVPGAGHLFEEPGALEDVADRAAAWFAAHVHGVPPDPPG